MSTVDPGPMSARFAQPRGILAVFTDGVRLAWLSLPATWPACVLGVVLYALAGPIITALTGEDPNDLGLGSPSDTEAVVEGATAAMLLGLYVALSLFLFLWINAIFLGAMSRLAGIGAGAGAALTRVPAMLGAALLFGFGVAVAAGLLGGLLGALVGWQTDAAALAVVGVAAFLAMLMMLGPGLAVLESAGPLRAVHRSVQLVLPRWVRVAGFMLLVLLINVGIALILGLAVTVLIHLVNPNSVATVLAWVVNPLLGAVFLIVGAGLACSLYGDLRTREAEAESRS